MYLNLISVSDSSTSNVWATQQQMADCNENVMINFQTMITINKTELRVQNSHASLSWSYKD